MKKLACLLFFLSCLFFSVGSAEASSGFSHTISLEPGWNLVSTPRLLSSHEFSASSTSANYDIYVMNPDSASKWSTMAEMNQTEFEPLFGYFINNKVGTTTTLIFNYRENTAPNERFFLRNIQAGWNSIGIANPSYALKQKDPDNLHTGNVTNIINSIASNIQSIYDLTANQTPKYSTKISNAWANATYSGGGSLDDFRETKAYVVYNTTNGTFNGSQNNDSISTSDYTPVNMVISNSNIATSTVKVGDEKAELGKFELGFSGVTEDVIVKTIKIKNNGNENLSQATMNLYLEQAGSKVSSGYSVDGSYVTFYLGAGLNISKNDIAKIIYIKGDVIAKENSASNSFQFILEKSTDFVVNEQATDFIVNIVNIHNAAANNYYISNITIDSGAVSISKKSTSPFDSTVINGSNGIIALIANVNADEAVTTDGLNLIYSSGNGIATSTDQFENARVYVNSVLLDSFDPVSVTSVSRAINSNLHLNKGDNEFKIIVNAKSTAKSSSDIKFIINDTAFNNMNPVYVVSGNTVASSSVSGGATGATLTVRGAELVTTRNDGYSVNRVIASGATDVSLGKFTVKAINDEIKITSVIFAANASTTLDSSIYDMKLFADGVHIGSTRDFASGVTFSSLNYTIAKDTTKNIELKGSFDELATGGFETLMTINSQDSRGASVNIGNIASTTVFSVLKGILNVDLGGNTPVASILVAKNIEQEVAQFKFTAINDDANLTELNIINTSIGTTSISSTSVGVASADPRIAAIKLYDGATLIDTFVPFNGAGKFTISNGSVRVMAGTNKTLSVRVVLSNIDNDASATNKDIHLGITTLKFISSNGYETTQSVAKLANNFRIRKTVPTVALQSLPSSVLVSGNQVISKFTVVADSNGDIELNKIVLNTYNSANATITALGVGSVLKVNGTYKTVASVATTTSTMTITLATNEVISAGTAKTFEILADLTVSGVGMEFIATRIIQDSAYSQDGNFVWSDGASITEPTYSNGYTVNGLPTDTQTLSN